MSLLTIQQTLPTRAVRESELMQVVNYELLEFFRQVRAAENLEYKNRFTVSTAATGVATVVATSPAMPTGSAWSVDAKAVCRATNNDGTDGHIHIAGLFSRQGGNAVQTGATATVFSVGPYTMAFAVAGQTLTVTVTDDAIHSVSWAVTLYVRQVP